MNQAHLSRFISDQSKRTRRYGIITAVLAFFCIAFFYTTDQKELGLKGTLLWRGIGFAGAVFFLAMQALKPNPRKLILFHGITLSAYLIMMLGISGLVFINPEYGVEQQFAVTTGTLTMLAISTLIAQGSRPFMIWSTGILVLIFLIIVFSAGTVNSGWPVSILILSVFSIFVLRSQNRQEKEKATYLYVLEEKEARIARQREELEEINANLVGFNYAITHDLKGALRRAQSFTQLVERRLPQEAKEDVKDLFELIKHNHDKILEIIKGLTLLNKIEKTELKMKTVALNDLVGKVWGDIESELDKERNLAFKLGQLGETQGDEGLIWHVFNNLLSNAVKYSNKKENPVIEVGVFEENNEQIVFVKDNGAGFPAKYAKDLGRPFKRLHSAHDFEGTGIGLAIVKQVVALHGGRFWGEGEEGKGATFYCSFPIQPEQK